MQTLTDTVLDILIFVVGKFIGTCIYYAIIETMARCLPYVHTSVC